MSNCWCQGARWLVAVLLVLVAGTLQAAGGLTEMAGRPQAPGLALVDLAGQPHRLADYRGRTLIINFWATWCPPCRAEMPAMNRAWRQLEPDGVVMLAVNTGESSGQVERFLAQHPIEFTVLLDTEGVASEAWAVPGLPTTYVVDPDGRVAYRVLGRREWDDAALLEQIRALGARADGPLTADSEP